MEFLINYWWVLVIIAAFVAVVGYAIYLFIKGPTPRQLNKIKEWLLYAVTEAQKELGDGTGQIKLRYTYDLFLSKFKFLSIILTFDKFSELVDEVLDKFRNMLDSNEKLNNYVNA